MSDVLYRSAMTADELHIVTLFSRMLRELEPLGHDLLPTERNLDAYWEHVFAPALADGAHGIILAFLDGECVGASFYTPERTQLDVAGGQRVSAHGLYVVPEHRCKGIGAALQKRAHRQLALCGFKRIVSQVLDANGHGLANVLRTGYQTLGRIVTLNLTEASNG